MFRLKTIYAIFILASLFLFGALYSSGKIPYVYINILLVLIAPAGYLYPDAFTYASIFVSWLAAYPALIFLCGVDPANASYSVILFDLLMASYLWYRNIVKRENDLRRRALKEKEDHRIALSDNCDSASRFESGIKAKETEIVNLYEITKKMSEYLKFEDIFRAFSSFLKGNFSFRKCDLLILARVDDKLRVDRAYSVWQKDPDNSAHPKPVNCEKLIELFANGFRDVYLKKIEDGQAFKNLGIEDDGIETFAVVPLLSERKMVGMLAVENLPKADLERFVILAMQFALEIKKVLLYEMVEKLAVTDSLTGLNVRRYFYERLEDELQRSKRYKFEFAFIMVDIDDFKKCNDTYGHMVGDVVIKDIARIIKESVREIDIVGRYGGEEFSIALPETGRSSASAVAERLRKNIEEGVFKAYDEKLKLTISAGVAVYPEDASDIDNIIDKADEALYRAKKLGKNVVCEYKR